MTFLGPNTIDTFFKCSTKNIQFWRKNGKIQKKHDISVFFWKNDQHKKLPKITSKLRRNILKTLLDRCGFPLGAKVILIATISTCRKVSHLKSTKGRFLGEIRDLFDFWYWKLSHLKTTPHIYYLRCASRYLGCKLLPL